MYKSIAIIGLSYELPGIRNWSELSRSLKSKGTNIGTLSPGRLQDIYDKYGPVEMDTGGFIDRVDLFDNEYFDVTEREAVKMYPEHRLFLLHALRAFYDAGYTEKDLEGSGTGIFLASGKSQYLSFLDGQYDFFNGLTGIEATRLAKFLDLRGPAVTVNTTCSSSLVALHNACMSLEQRECDMVLTGGVRIGTITKERAGDFAIMSRTGACRPFDKDADGTMNGEGAVCMVLKRLEDAIRDEDPIYATIEGSAVNHGGARISSLTAPSIEAQKEVILKAWENARVDPKDIRFIEAHGTGTILGDPIEFSGISEAFTEKGVTGLTCKISSVKAQIGHLDTLCGLAGLLRVIAALNNKIIPPQANFAVINEHIEETDNVIEVQREPEYWDAGNGIRIGGVSSFGLTGTNVHMVVAHKEEESRLAADSDLYFLQLGAPTPERLSDIKQEISNVLENNRHTNLDALSRKLNRLYNVGKYNEGLSFTDSASLLKGLQQPVAVPEKETIFLLMDLDLQEYDRELIGTIFNENSLIKKCWEDLVGAAYLPERISDDKVTSVLFQYVLYKYLLSIPEGKMQVVTRQGEGILQQLLNNKVRPADIVQDPSLIIDNENSFNRQNFEYYLFKNFRQQRVILVDFSKGRQMQFPDADNVINISGGFERKERFLLYSELLASGRSPLKVPNVPVFLYDAQFPVYKLSRFWPKNVPSANVGQKATEPVEKIDKGVLTLAEIEARLKPIWKKLLEIEGDIAADDDFFEQGGDSLAGLDLLGQLNKEFKKNLIIYEEMFSYSTFGGLCGVLHDRLTGITVMPKLQAPVSANVAEKATGTVAVVKESEDATFRENKYKALLDTIQQSGALARITHGDILITGSTGFIGSFLVKRILDSTDANIICMARDKKGQRAEERFWSVFNESFGISAHERIRVVNADITDENLLSDKESRELLKNVTTVYHAAGSPAFVGNPNLQEHISFKGTKRIFDWALSNKIKSFNHISTIGITGNGLPEHIESFYETDLNMGQNVENYVHSATKLMAEEYINAHRSPDMGVNIFRIPNAGGRYDDGFTLLHMESNLMYMKLRRICKAGCYSDEFLEHNLNFRIVPVDMLIKVVCELSFYQHKHLSTFHLPFEKGFTMPEIIDAFIKNGIKLTKLDNNDFREYMRKWEENSEEYSVKLIKYGIYDKVRGRNYKIKTDATRLTLEKIKEPVAYDRLTYLKNVVSYCLKEGFLNTDTSLSPNFINQ
ncbi:beta-ketoacyl synthase N-terminal-like domain-containing protein [Chitinophaga flava]|uniref:Uncharacterized protein n=1 Tax=Chitinophaga flava TaxID=2259036 RepID=A0A365XUP7_9BACT|nr:beta-ketoacyl synthase N-terminal-like domain-containing protein [Chitinophaga flava]RBL90069.1 hypothetical protein DF182_26725 [Chitinophaga flava]